MNMGEKGLNTNLATEFYTLAMLYREEFEASLTLGNKKSVDIFVKIGNKVKTIDVKGIQAKNNSIPVNNYIKKEDHFLVFVIINKTKGKEPWEVYVLPSLELDQKIIIHHFKKEKRVYISNLRNFRNEYQNRWDLLKK